MMTTLIQTQATNAVAVNSLAVNAHSQPMLTEDDFLAWLNNPQANRVVLVELEAVTMCVPNPLAPDTYDFEHTKFYYMSTTGFTTQPADYPANTHYDAIIVGGCNYNAKMTEAFFGRSTQSWGEVIVDNSNGQRDDWLKYAWAGCRCRILVGDSSWARSQFWQVVDGTIQEVKSTDCHKIGFIIKDRLESLNREVQTNNYPDTAAVDSIKGAPVPLAFGQPFNIEPVLINDAAHRYQVHDGQINAILEVRDNGVPVTFNADLSTGTFTLNAAPAGRITADVQGAVVSGVWLSSAADIMRYLILSRGGASVPDVVEASFASLNAVAGGTVGLFIKERRNVLEILDELAMSVGAFWAEDGLGRVYVGKVKLPPFGTTPTKIADEHNVALDSLRCLRILTPTKQWRFRWRKNYAVQEVASLAGSVSPALKSLYATEWQANPQFVTDIFLNIQDALNWRSTRTQEWDSLLVNLTDATAEAVARKNRFSMATAVIGLTMVQGEGYNIRLGDIVKVELNRFGFNSLSSNSLGFVVSVAHDYLAETTQLELWMHWSTIYPEGCGI